MGRSRRLPRCDDDGVDGLKREVLKAMIMMMKPRMRMALEEARSGPPYRDVAKLYLGVLGLPHLVLAKDQRRWKGPEVGRGPSRQL
jgi:hypothetical protein